MLDDIIVSCLEISKLATCAELKILIMKFIYFKITSLLLISIFAVSCEKEPNSNALSKQHILNPVINESKDSLKALIRHYDQVVCSKRYSKTSSEITTEDAIWVIEALANYHFATQYFFSTNTTVDTLVVPLYCYQNNLGDVVSNLGDVVDAFDAISDSLTANGTTINYLFLDIQGSVDLNTNTAMIIVHSFKAPSYSISPDSITVNDNWHAGGGEGNCAKQFRGQDAQTRIKRHLDWNMYNGFTVNSYGSYVPGSTFFVNIAPLNFVSTPNQLGQYLDPFINLSPAYGSHYLTDYCIPYNRIQTYANLAFAEITAHRPVGYEALYAITNQTITPMNWSFSKDKVVHSLNGAYYGVPL
jgi:hypothetical protein